MSTAIPPLVCSTPPPIDFDDDNINNLNDNNNGNNNNNNHHNNNNNNININYDVDDDDDDDFSAFETNDGNFQTYVDSIPSTPTHHVYDNSFSELQINDDGDGLQQQPPPPPPPDDFDLYPKPLPYQLPNNTILKGLAHSKLEQQEQQHDLQHIDDKIDENSNAKSHAEQQFKSTTTTTTESSSKESTNSLKEFDIENNINNNNNNKINLNLVKGENGPAHNDDSNDINENQFVLNVQNNCDNDKIIDNEKIIDNYHHSIPYRNESPPSLILSQNDNSYSYNDDYIGDGEDDVINETPNDTVTAVHDDFLEEQDDGIHDNDFNEFNEFQENEIIDNTIATTTTTTTIPFKLDSIKNPLSSSSILLNDESVEKIIFEKLNDNKIIVSETVDNKIISDVDNNSINKTESIVNNLEETHSKSNEIIIANDEDDDNNFGDFNEFPLDNNLEKCTKHTTDCDINIKENVIVNDDDDDADDDEKDIYDKGAIKIKDKVDVDANTMDNTNAVFVADFSQFSCSFENNENTINNDSENNLNDKIIIQKNNEDVDDDDDDESKNNDNDFDEFDDFQNFTTTTTNSDDNKIETNSNNSSEIIKHNTDNGDVKKGVDANVNDENIEEEDDEDDFGDFNDFTQSTSMPINESNTFSTTVTNLKTIQERIEPILMVMFPDQSKSVDDNQNNNDKDNDIEKYIQNSISKYINDFENSKALQHQWINSKTKTTLITSLGIDSRNILHTGGKWNSSMPRFATNLGFSPLEPLKSDALTTTLQSGIDNKHLDSLNSHVASSKSTDVPAAQFDWNSSGLVNPLDGVQEILHKTSAPQNKSSWIETNRSTTTTTIDTIEQPPQQYLQQSSKSTSSSLPSSTTIIGTTTLSFPAAAAAAAAGSTTTTNTEAISNETTNNKIIDKDIISSSTTTTTTTKITTTPIDDDDNNLLSTASTTSTITSLSMITPTIISELKSTPITSQEKQNSELSSINDFSITFNNMKNDNILCESPPPLPISSSYVIPGSGTLKETHIFTPTKGGSPPSQPQPQPCPIIATVISPTQSSSISIKENPINDVPYNDYDFEKASAAGIRINENVVKKEYRDIEYNPEKILNPTNNINDDFSDFQSSVVSSSSLPQIIPLTIPKQQHSTIDLLQPIKSELKIDNSFSFSSLQNNNDDKKYTKPTIGISPTDKMFSSPSSTLNSANNNNNQQNNNDDEFSDFQSVEISQKIIIPTISKSLSPVMLQTIAPPPPPGPSQQLPPSSIPQSSFVQQIPSTATTILSPTNLLQPIQPQQTYDILQPSNDKSVFQQQQNQINWPDPGIAPDEMARLEAMFPQKKISQSKSVNVNQIQQQSSNIKPQQMITNNNHDNNTNMTRKNKKCESPQKSLDDDDWSEFVSGGSTIIQPITHIINKNIIKHQISDIAAAASASAQKTSTSISSTTEDEWTDFVSNVQPSSVNIKNYNNSSGSSAWINTSGPNFPSWNTPASLQQSSVGVPSQFSSGYTGSTSQMISQQYSNQFYAVPTTIITTNHTNTTNNNNNNNQQFHLKSHSQISHLSNNRLNNNNNLIIKNPLSQRTPSISLIPDLGFIGPTRTTNFHNHTKK